MIRFRVPRSFRFQTNCILALIALASVGACTSEESKRKLAAEESMKVLRMTVGGSPQTIDPHQVAGSPGLSILKTINTNLVRYNKETYSIEPSLAESWHISEDGLTYSFILRDGLKWSDGKDFVADDIVYSFARMMAPGLGNQYALDFYSVEGAEEYHKGFTSDISSLGVTAPSPKQVVFSLIKPDPLFLKRYAALQSSPVRKDVVEAHGEMDDPTNRWILAGNFVGMGPFKLVDWQLNKIIEVEKNPYYWNADKILIDKIKIPVVETEVADERLYRAGEIDLTLQGRVPVSKLDYYRNERPDELVSHDIYGTYFYLFNTSKPPFNNKNLRKAFALSVDRNLLVERVTRNGEKPAYAFALVTPSYDPPKAGEFNPDLAREYLAKAGFPNGKGAPEITLIYNTMDTHKKIAVALQQMWKKELNVSVSIENQEWKVFLSNRQNHDFQLARAGSLSPMMDPSDFLDSLVTGHGMNDAAWSNVEYDRLIAKAKKTVDESARLAILKEAEEIMVEELPILPIFYYRQSHLIRPTIKGIKFNMTTYIDFEGVTIDD